MNAAQPITQTNPLSIESIDTSCYVNENTSLTRVTPSSPHYDQTTGKVVWKRAPPGYQLLLSNWIIK